MSPEDRLPWLGDLLVATDADGRRKYTVEQAEDFLAALLLTQNLSAPEGLPPDLAGLLERFAARAEVPADADRATADHAVAAYFAAHPIPEDLRRDFGARYRSELAELDVQGLAGASLRVTGQDPIAKKKAAPGAGPKGALAFFAARASLDD